MAGLTAVGGQVEKRESTLNERLNRVADLIDFQCDRLESVLARVNGTPQKVENATTSTATPMRPMNGAIETLEVLGQRLADLVSGVERIA